jgi:hypothetical protein
MDGLIIVCVMLLQKKNGELNRQLEVQDPRQEQVGVGHPKVANYVFKLSRQLQIFFI